MTMTMIMNLIDEFNYEMDVIGETSPEWYNTMHQHKVHPLVEKLILSGFEPASISQLVFEWPHLVDSDPSMVAYARDERSHKERRYTHAKLGKYIRRHFPSLKDHEIRDLVAPYNNHKFHILTDTRDMVAAVLFGPQSCMKWGEFDVGPGAYASAKSWWYDREDDYSGWEFCHPYCVYDPELGWGVAVRLKDGQIAGRAVVHTTKKIYVRTYVLRSSYSSQSSDDDFLVSWLKSQGYQKVPYWPEGVEFTRRDHGYFDRRLLMPYLDGDSNTHRRVTVVGDKVVRDDNGEFVANSTEGYVSDVTPEAWCYSCGEPIYNSNDMYEVRHAGCFACVCRRCADAHYERARYYTRYNGEDEGLIHSRDVVAVYCGPEQPIQMWDEYGLSPEIVRLDEPVEKDGMTCWYAEAIYTTFTLDGRRVVADVTNEEVA